MLTYREFASVRGSENATAVGRVTNAPQTSTRESPHVAGGRFAARTKHKATFHEDRDRRRHGFDRTSSPRYQMVPLQMNIPGHDQSRSVEVRFYPPLQRDWMLDFEIDFDPQALEVMPVIHGGRMSTAILSIEGKKSALSDVTVRDKSGNVVGRLEVSVKDPMANTIAFFEPKVGGDSLTERFTRKRPTDLRNWVKGVNNILEPQANVSLILSSSSPIPLLLNESDVVTSATSAAGKRTDRRRISDAESDLIAAEVHRRNRADVSVVLVRDVRDENFGKDDTEAWYVPTTNTIFIDDITGADTQTLAHEVVHWLLELNGNADPFPGPKKGHRRGKQFLMHEDENGTRIGRIVADIINESGTTRSTP